MRLKRTLFESVGLPFGKAPSIFIDPLSSEVTSALDSRTQGITLRERALMHEFVNVIDIAQLEADPTQIMVPSRFNRDPFDWVYLKNNVIPIHGEVNNRMADDVAFMAQHILSAMINGTKKGNPIIHFIVNSGGGSIVAESSIMENMENLKGAKIEGKPVIVATYCQGIAGSAASSIFINGTPGYRYIGPYSEVMIHQPQYSAGGRATNIDIHTKRAERMKEDNVQLLKRVSKMDEAEIRRRLEEDTYLTAGEAIELGLADVLWEDYTDSGFSEFGLLVEGNKGSLGG